MDRQKVPVCANYHPIEDVIDPVLVVDVYTSQLLKIGELPPNMSYVRALKEFACLALSISIKPQDLRDGEQ